MPALLDCLNALKAKAAANIASGVAPAAKSAHGLFESDFDLFDVGDANVQALRGFCDETVRLAAAHVNGGRTDPARLRVEFRDSWFHITNGGGFHDVHGHGGCSWCGIFYVRAGDSGRREGASAPNGVNRFYSPFGSGGAYRDAGNEYLNFNYIDPPPRDGNYSVAAFGLDIEAALDALALDEVILVGHSMGGSASIAFAVQHPDRVAALLLAGTPGKATAAQGQTVLNLMRAVSLRSNGRSGVLPHASSRSASTSSR